MASNVMSQFPEKTKVKFKFGNTKLDMRDAVACELAFEKFVGGFRIRCACDDSLACEDFQMLCDSICDRDCSCCCVRDGMQMCCFNLACCKCKYEQTEGGCTLTCTSRDTKCCDMLKSMCECLETCCQNGCCCYICFGDKCCCFGSCDV